MKYIVSLMKSYSYLLFGIILTFYLSLVQQKDHILPNQLMYGDLFLLVRQGLLRQTLHHIQVAEIWIHSVRNEKVLHLLQNLLQHLDLL